MSSAEGINKLYAEQPKSNKLDNRKWDYDGDPRFLSVLEEMRTLHVSKGHDYAHKQDPFANVRASEDFGIPGWVGGMIRLNDKVRRVQNFAKRGELKHESVEDSLLDIAVYAVINLILFREEAAKRDEESLPF